MNISKLIALVAIVGTLNFGYSFAAPLIDVSWAAYKSTQWKQTAGAVVRAAVEQTRKGIQYPVVEYSYVVSGQEYQSSRISFTGGDHEKVSPQEFASHYAVKKPVNVFFNPAEPSQAVLIPGLHSMIPLVILIVGFLTIVGVLSAFLKVFVRSKPMEKR